jgi:hypothetical protein
MIKIRIAVNELQSILFYPPKRTAPYFADSTFFFPKCKIAT